MLSFLLVPFEHRCWTAQKELWAARDTSQLQSTLINENYLKKSLTQKHNNLHVDVGHKKQQSTKLFGARGRGAGSAVTSQVASSCDLNFVRLFYAQKCHRFKKYVRLFMGVVTVTFVSQPTRKAFFFETKTKWLKTCQKQDFWQSNLRLGRCWKNVRSVYGKHKRFVNFLDCRISDNSFFLLELTAFAGEIDCEGTEIGSLEIPTTKIFRNSWNVNRRACCHKHCEMKSKTGSTDFFSVRLNFKWN